ncbi:hypothetical protein C8F01DRAFT_1329388 [Mycena amicta]|nr:hypothetical protein C8F01DRAFT_1329388 [Mycena amicta]
MRTMILIPTTFAADALHSHPCRPPSVFLASSTYLRWTSPSASIPAADKRPHTALLRESVLRQRSFPQLPPILHITLPPSHTCGSRIPHSVEAATFPSIERVALFGGVGDIVVYPQASSSSAASPSSLAIGIVHGRPPPQHHIVRFVVSFTIHDLPLGLEVQSDPPPLQRQRRILARLAVLASVLHRLVYATGRNVQALIMMTKTKLGEDWGDGETEDGIAAEAYGRLRNRQQDDDADSGAFEREPIVLLAVSPDLMPSRRLALRLKLSNMYPTLRLRPRVAVPPSWHSPPLLRPLSSSSGSSSPSALRLCANLCSSRSRSSFGGGARLPGDSKSQNLHLRGVGTQCGPRNAIDEFKPKTAFITPRFRTRLINNWDYADSRVEYIRNWGQAGRC